MELAGQEIQALPHIYGIDFSGDKDAGKKIWLQKGIAKGKMLCEKNNTTQRYPLQRRTSSPTLRVRHLRTFTCDMR